MSDRDYDALVIDLDGTLLDDQSRLPERSRKALQAAAASGVRVLVATGRSSISAHPILVELGLAEPAIVFNGAALYCPRTRRMLEERTLSGRSLERTLAFAREQEHALVLMAAERKLATHPRDEAEASAMGLMTALEYCSHEELQLDWTIRVTLFSRRHADSHALAADFEAAVDQPLYLTHFPLRALATHRASPLQVLDVQPPCRGKGEALRVLEELYGIPAERVVAVGDATNDIPMFEAAGLSVAMGNSMSEARAVAQRVIGTNESGAIAELVEELFLGRRVSTS